MDNELKQHEIQIVEVKLKVFGEIIHYTDTMRRWGEIIIQLN